jgi:hypothetical protein
MPDECDDDNDKTKRVIWIHVLDPRRLDGWGFVAAETLSLLTTFCTDAANAGLSED